MEKLENYNLDLFLIDMGVLPADFGDIEELEEIVDPRRVCMQKGYYRNPYDENGEVLF